MAIASAGDVFVAHMPNIGNFKILLLMTFLCSFGSQKCNLLKASMFMPKSQLDSILSEATLAQEAFCLENWCVRF